MRPAARRRSLQLAAVSLAALPGVALAIRAATTGLGANPIETITHTTGEWSLRFVLVALAVSPLRRRLGWAWLAPLRRTFGLAAFAWVCLHFSTWVALDQFFDVGAMWEDIRERPYITVGFAGFLCLVPLALTSTRSWQRRLGRRWVTLHRLVFAAAGCGVVHHLWLVKGDDLAAPLSEAGILALLVAERWLPRRRPAPGRGSGAPSPDRPSRAGGAPPEAR